MGVKLRFERPFVRDNTDKVVKAESDIIVNSQQIALRVTQQTFNALQGRVENAESTLVLQANEIASKVSQSTYNALVDRVSNAESTIVQQASQISSKVSQTDYNGNTIASLINQTATSVKIQAQKIQLEGLVTANSHFKVLLDGSIEAVNGKFSGNITGSNINIGGKFSVDTSGNLVATSASITGNISGSSINGGTINIGSRFSVDTNGNLVASNAVLSGSIVATRMSASSNPSLYGEIGVADNYPGLALYDLRYNSNPYFKIMEASSGNAVLMRDKNDVSRIIMTTGSTNGIVINDSDGTNRAQFSNEITRLWSPGNTTRFDMTDTYVRIVRNGSIIAQW